ncbi:DUF6468 domain-containing protein [uncultured Roseibium sp.]|uniref:DUF6468 domain-containing protein n=1 Tax=uncultured Roseibium sp. TaxID=1936171 RepID=UPI0032167F8F
MSTPPVGMIIEGLVAILLLVTIAYCWILNSRLQRLRADEETLRATISELMTATEIAERAILGLKATASEADQSLGNRLNQAEKMSNALAAQVVKGEEVFTRISQIAEAANRSSVQREAYAHAPQPAPMPVQMPQMPQMSAPTMQDPAPRGRAPRADDIRSAAAEATARLEQFRRRSGGTAA